MSSSVDNQVAPNPPQNNIYTISTNGQYVTAVAVDAGLSLTSKPSTGFTDAQKWICDGSTLMPKSNSTDYAAPASSVAANVAVNLVSTPYSWTINYLPQNSSVTIRAGDGSYLFWDSEGQNVALVASPVPWTFTVVS